MNDCHTDVSGESEKERERLSVMQISHSHHKDTHTHHKDTPLLVHLVSYTSTVVGGLFGEQLGTCVGGSATGGGEVKARVDPCRKAKVSNHSIVVLCQQNVLQLNTTVQFNHS